MGQAATTIAALQHVIWQAGRCCLLHKLSYGWCVMWGVHRQKASRCYLSEYEEWWIPVASVKVSPLSQGRAGGEMLFIRAVTGS
ncbi:hypothetical protein AAFF_G00106210 [Aldrovandia affinis]|uniref:Uncharacterized protein n=1 Tax=Aldrovandia affinis TaxID=143900 RepID=A0AAD7WYN8_9TELE|nr:hypothetical protein AAFF_G00106210 [Aldrovandia affinis]